MDHFLYESFKVIKDTIVETCQDSLMPVSQGAVLR